jgi:hypothetical protein
MHSSARYVRMAMLMLCAAVGVTAPPASSQQPPAEPVSFSVIGDVPYTSTEALEFEQHIADHNLYSDAEFFVHVGDIKAGSSTCVEQQYSDMAMRLGALAVPAFIVPGDNEWTDCADPAQGWAWWETHLLGLEQGFCGVPTVDAQVARPENFSFEKQGVRFVGLNLVPGAPSSVYQASADWLDAQFAAHAATARAFVVIAQAEAFGVVFDAMVANGGAYGGPVLYLHGDGHGWEEDASFFGLPNMLRVQVDRGIAANPPVRVTVTELGDFLFDRDPWPIGTPVYDAPPCADAGTGFTTQLSDLAMLDGLASDDGVPAALTIGWSQLSGPGTTTFGDPAAAATTATFSAVGTYVLELAANDGATLVTSTVQVVVDPDQPTVSIDDVVVTEGDTAQFTVMLGGADGSTVQVDYATGDDTAQAGSDYASTSGTLTFGGATTQEQVSVTIAQDADIEGDETFFIDLTNASGATIGKSRGTATIQDDDVPAQFDVDVSLLGSGSVVLDPPGGSYEAGTLVTLTAVPDAGNVFDGWSGALGGTLNPQSLLVLANVSVTAAFSPVPAGQFGLGILIDGAGSVAASPAGSIHPAGTVVTLTPTPAAGQSFAGWSGDLGGAQAPASLVMDAQKTVTATFVATPPAGAVVLQEVTTGGSTGVAQVSTDTAVLGASGQLYVAAVTSKKFHVVTGVSGLGLAWTPAGVQCGARSQTGISLYTALGNPPGDGVVTATFDSAPINAEIAVSRYSGADVTAPISGGAALNTLGIDGPCSGGTDLDAYSLPVTTVGSDSVLYLAAAMRNRDHIPPAGLVEQVEIYRGGGGDVAGLSVADGAAATAGTYTLAGGFSKVVDYAVAGLEIVAAGAPLAYDVTVVPPVGGSVSLDPPGGSYAPGTVVTVTASPDLGHRFDGWSGDLAGATNPETIVVDADKSVAASFVQQFSVSIAPLTGGSIALSPPGGVYDAGTTVTVSATPDAGFEFGGWSGDLSGTINPETLVVDADKNIGALFGQTFTLSVAPTAGGSVSLSPPGGVYVAGTSVTVTAVPDAGQAFTGWSGDLSGATNPETVVVDADKNIGASFAPAFTVSLAPGAGGSITLDPPGGSYVSGTLVTVTAIPDLGHRFDAWGGALVGSTNPQSLVVDADKTVAAAFIEQHLLAVSAGAGGSVTLDPPGGLYDTGTTVTLTATPDPGFRFAGWSGDLSGTANPAPILVDADRSVAATFVQLFSVSVSPSPGGSIALSPPGGVYDAGTSVTVTATPDAGLSFAGWSGDLSGTTNPETLVVDADKNIGASFEQTFALNVSPGTGGSITLEPPGGVYAAGTAVTVTAVADAGFAFTGWSGDLAGATNPETLVVDADKSVAASFAAAFSLSVAPGAGGSIALEPPGGSYLDGTVVTVTAVPNANYRFDAWGGNLSGTTNPETLVVDGDKTVTASFVEQFSLSVSAGPGGSVTLNPPGGLYDAGTVVTLTAVPDVDFALSGWGGDLGGAQNPEALAMDADKSVTATFVSTSGGGGVVFHEITSGGSSSQASVSTAAPVPAASGDLYLAAISSKRYRAVTGVTGLGLSWTPLQIQCGARSQTGLTVYAALGNPTGDGVVTATFASSPNSAEIAVSRYSGAAVAAPIGGSASVNALGLDGACAGGSDADSYSLPLVTVAQDSVLYLAAATRHRDHLLPAGFVEQAVLRFGSGGNVVGLSIAEGSAGAPGAVTHDGGFSRRVDFAVVGLEIVPASP